MSNRAREELIDLSAQNRGNQGGGKRRAQPARAQSSRSAPQRAKASSGGSRSAPARRGGSGGGSSRQSDAGFQFAKKQAARKARVRRNRLILLASLVIIVGAVVGINLLMTVGAGTDVFYEGVRVDGLELKGYTQAEAVEKLTQLNYERLANMEVKLYFEDQEWTIPGERLGVHLDIEEQVELAWQQGREGNVFERQSRIGELKKTPYSATTTMSYDRAMLESELLEIKARIDVPAKDAWMDFDPSRDEIFIPRAEEAGREVPFDGLLRTAVAQLDNGIYAPIAIEPVPVEPAIFKDDLVLATSRIKRVQTPLGDSKAERIHNIKLALSMFNGMIIQPGEEVSFNQVTGPRGLEQGYQNAGVIVDDEIVDGPGGGVCQVSTTLYQAVVRSGLQIVKRSKHTLPVSYVPIGADAAVAYDYMDLVFKNNTELPIYLICEVIGSDVVVTVHGRPLEDGVEIKIVNEILEKIPAPEPEIIQDADAQYVTYSDEFHDLKKCREGYKVKTYAVWYMDGEEFDREQLTNDYYKEVVGKRYVGVTARPGGSTGTPTDTPVIGQDGGGQGTEEIPVIGAGD